MPDYTFIFDIHGIADFEGRVLNASRKNPVMVDFWADWCGPCLFLDPVLKSVIPEFHGKVLLAKLDTDEDENMKLAGRYQVRGFPTVLLIENGEETARFTSAQSKSFVREFIGANSRLLTTINIAQP